MFLDRITNHQTIYNLYMGRNEFPLSYNLCNIFDYESIFLNKNNIFIIIVIIIDFMEFI